MKLYKKEFEDALEDFLTLNVKFHKVHEQYLFQENWVSQPNHSFYKDKIISIKKLLIKHLNNGLENKSYLSIIRDKIRNTMAKFYNEDYSDFSFFEKTNTLIRTTDNELLLPPVEEFDYDYFLKQTYIEKYKEDNFAQLDEDILYYHDFLKKNFDSSKTTKIEFERIKLMYAIVCYQDIIYDFLNYIEYIYFNYEFINFSRNEEVKVEDTITEEEIESYMNENKCKLNINKKTFAKVINILMMDSILYFDSSDAANNKILVQKFFEKNFSYKGSDGNQKEVKSLNKEFAMNHFEIKDNRNAFLDKLISEINDKKSAN